MKDKIQIFLLGLMLGLLVGLGFFILKLDDYFQELSFYKNLSKNFIHNIVEKKAETNSEQTDNKTIVRQSYKQVPSSVKVVKPDTLKSFSANEAALTDSVSFRDSLRLQSLENNSDENVIVKKDELLSTKNITVVILDELKDGAKIKKDSLLQVVSGIKNDEPGNLLNIEYWKSPLNYKGYKMAKNKLILYGFTPDDDIKLYRYDGNIYLKNPGGTYNLEYSGDFKQLEKVIDEKVLAVLK